MHDTPIRQWARSRPLTVVLTLALICVLTAVRISKSDASTGTGRYASAAPAASTAGATPGGATGPPGGSSSASGQETTSSPTTTGSDDPSSSTTGGETAGTGSSTRDGSATGTDIETGGDAGTTTRGSGSEASTGDDTAADGPTKNGASNASDAWRSTFFSGLPRRWGVTGIDVRDGPSYGLEIVFVDNERPETGDVVATVKYLGYACIGTWKLDALTSSTVVLHEEVEVDRTAAADRQCAPDATVELERRSPSRIHYEASGYSDGADASYGVVPAVGTLIPAA